MGTLDKRYTSSSIAKMILSRLAFSAAVVAGQYADYYNNYSDLDIDSIDKGFVFSATDDLGNKKNKNQQDFFGQAAKQQLDANLANTHHVNGHTCWLQWRRYNARYCWIQLWTICHQHLQAMLPR